jgi:hypothetical protein
VYLIKVICGGKIASVFATVKDAKQYADERNATPLKLN